MDNKRQEHAVSDAGILRMTMTVAAADQYRPETSGIYTVVDELEITIAILGLEYNIIFGVLSVLGSFTLN